MRPFLCGEPFVSDDVLLKELNGAMAECEETATKLKFTELTSIKSVAPSAVQETFKKRSRNVMQ